MQPEDLIGHFYKDIKKYYPNLNFFISQKDGVPKEDINPQHPDFTIEIIDGIVVTAKKI